MFPNPGAERPYSKMVCCIFDGTELLFKIPFYLLAPLNYTSTRAAGFEPSMLFNIIRTEL